MKLFISWGLVVQAVSWIMVTGFAQIFILIALFIAATTNHMVCPVGFHLTLFLIYIGGSVGSIAQSQAFTPIDDKVQTLGVALAKSVTQILRSTSRLSIGIVVSVRWQF